MQPSHGHFEQLNLTKQRKSCILFICHHPHFVVGNAGTIHISFWGQALNCVRYHTIQSLSPKSNSIHKASVKLGQFVLA